MATSVLVILKLAEESYAADSSSAYNKAEDEARRSNAYPVVYPEPFNSIGCGYGPLNDYVRKQCSAVASELGLDSDFCIQSELQVTLYCGTKADYAKFVQTLGVRLQAVKGWVINSSQLWPGTDVTETPQGASRSPGM
ncbi:hypothetical protein [Azonexus hydrophilus]|uniref:Uncharacterized protein n=1 Tax=Azonexus hydrophilus TaxID=418702 RepID=A0ABZ2XPT0_9RHOO